MATYRAFLIGEDGHFKEVHLLEGCFTDDQAIEAARQYVDGHGVEVWNLEQLVARLTASVARRAVQPKENK